ncbi:MAG: DJ-1/PfpI family protein [Treponema sp.]|nr:DJ-1/PfpI family protein [Treponema sp.]
MKHVAVLLAPGFEEIEALSPVDYLRRAGVSVTLVSIPVKGKCDTLVEGAHGIAVRSDTSFDAYVDLVAGCLPDAVFIPGGMPGAANIGDCNQALDFIKQMCNAKKIVSAICAAPVVVLAKTGILAGKNWTSYPGMEQELNEYVGDDYQTVIQGSTYHKDKPFITDGTIVTGRGPGCAEQFAMELVRLLCGESVAKKIHDGSVQR